MAARIHPLGWETGPGRISLIQPGPFADLVATAGDPLKDPALFSQVTFVMKGGKVYRQAGRSVVTE